MTREEYEILNERYTVALDEAKAFLFDTDYKVIKQAEGVEAMTDELKAKRQEARDTINEMTENLERLCERRINEQPMEE